MKNKIISLFMAVLFLFNCYVPSLVLAEPSAQMLLKYFDIEENKYVEEGEALLVNKEYYLEVWAKDMENLIGGCHPLHFNNEVVEIVSYNEGNKISQSILGFGGGQHIKANEEKYWMIVEEDTTPYISNSKGIIETNFLNALMMPVNIDGEELMYSFRFKTKAGGNTEFREYDPDLDGFDSNIFSSDGVYFGGSHYGVGDAFFIDFVKNLEAKHVGYPVDGVEINKESLNLSIGESETLTALVSPENAVSKKVTWTSSDDTVATVDQNGVVTAIGIGTAQITVETVWGGRIDSCTVKVIDANTPTTPEDLAIVSKTGKSVEFAWSESTGNSGVEGYNIYRDGVLIGTTQECSFTDDTGVEGVEYTYTVEAYYADLKSPMSSGLKVVLQSPEIVEVIPESQTVFGSNQKQNVYVYYKDTYNSSAAKLKVEYRDTGSGEYKEYIPDDATLEKGTVDADKLNYFKFELDPENIENSGNEYIFRFTVTDKDGCTGTKENIVYSIVYPPEKLTGFQAVEGARSILLSWNISGSYYAQKYKLFRKLSGSEDWELIKTINGRKIIYYEDTDVVQEQSYDYYVIAVDTFGQESEPALVEGALPGEDKEKPIIVSISPNDGATICGQEEITVNLYDNVGISRAEIYYSVDGGENWEPIYANDGSETTVRAILDTTLFDTTQLNDNQVKVKAVAYDVDGNRSDETLEPVRTYIIDNEGPDKVTGLRGNADSSTQITLTWNDVEAKDLHYFVVEQKNGDGTYTAIGGKVYDVAGMHIKDLIPGTEYTYRVVAYDKVGNRGIESDDCTVTTKPDSVEPVVTRIDPSSKKIAENLDMTFTVTDDYAVDSITVQTSTDGKDWVNVGVVDAPTKLKKVTFLYTLDISGYNDGLIWVRAIPKDTYGNEGVSDTTAPFNQYKIDTTPPVPPQNLKVGATDGYIEVEWDSSATPEESVPYYIVERATAQGGPYEVVAPRHPHTSYIDYNATGGVTYYYRVRAVDDMGNVSGYSDVVEGEKLPDSTPPVIEGIIPRTGSYISNRSTITVYASDNNAIDHVTLEYKAEGESSWKPVGTMYKEISDFPIDSLNLGEGEYVFMARAWDAAGNVSAPSAEYRYIVDTTAPVISDVEMDAGVGSLTVTWKCEPHEDLFETCIYYKASDKSSYTFLKYFEAEEDCKYSYTIEGLDASKDYDIKITATDYANNTSQYVSSSTGTGIEPPDEPQVPLQISISGPSDVVVGNEEQFSVRIEKGTGRIVRYMWEFGDGSLSALQNPIHKYDNVGTYQMSVVCFDDNNNKLTATKTVNVVKPEDVGTIVLSVIDDSGSPVQDATVIFNCTDVEKMQQLTTDPYGKLTITAAPGSYEIGFYKDGYLPAQKRFDIVKNSTIEKVVSIVKKNIVIGELTWKRMTLAEIEDAGIDTSKPGNQNVFKYEMTLTVGREEVKISGHKPDDGKPIKYTHSGGYSGGTLTSNTLYIFDFNDKSDYNYDADTEEGKKTAPRTIVAYVQVPGEVAWLKEFFDVSLNIFNQAEAKFMLKDCEATLIYPTSGLTLTGGDVTVDMGDIAGQQGQTANWILRGDVEGEYPIKADFTGHLGIMEEGVFVPWDIAIEQPFESERPIKVYGNEGLTFVIECENDIVALTEGTDSASIVTDSLAFRVGLRNASILTRYNAKAIVDEGDNLKALPGYQNYIEDLQGQRRADASELRYGETVYSDFVVDGLLSTDVLKQLIIRKVREGSNVDLPIEFKEVEPRAFHTRRIEAYGIDKNGEMMPVNTFSINAGESMTFAVHITELLPGAEEYSDCAGIDVYMNGKHIGVTDNAGVCEYIYTAPSHSEFPASPNVKLVFRGSRTEETSIMVQLLDDTTILKGYVHDTYGNILRDVKVKVSRIADDGSETVVGETYTDKRGRFEFDEGIKAGKNKIELEKDKYKPLTEVVDLAIGDVELMYNMERIRVKPKVVSVAPKNIGENVKNIIIPEGLVLNEDLNVKTNTEEGVRLTGCRLERVPANGGASVVIDESKSSTLSLDTSLLVSGDKVQVIAIADGNMESDPYELPITVIEAPFTHLLNLRGTEAAFGELNAKISFASLFRNISDKQGHSGYWLTGETKQAWEKLFAQFEADLMLDIGDASLETNTRFIIDWFDYNNFMVYVNYNFETGELSISPNPVGRKYYMFTSSGMGYDNAYRTNVKLENSRYGRSTGYINVIEDVKEDIRVPSSGRYGYLITKSDRKWDIETLFGVSFTLEDGEWNGTFELSSDEQNSSYGTFLRHLKPYQNFASWDMPETQQASWYKSVDIKNDVDVPLTNEGIDNSVVSINYTGSTNSYWSSGAGHIILGSEMNNVISVLPTHRIQGTTQLTGGYYVFNYYRPLYENKQSLTRYDIDYSAKLFASNGSEEFEPISGVKLHGASGSDIVDETIYANAEVSLADGNKPAVAYLDENGKVVISRFENGWGSPVDAGNVNNAHYPAIDSDEDTTVVVWSENDTSFIPKDDGTLTIDQIQQAVAANMDISYGLYRDGKVVSTGKISNDGAVVGGNSVAKCLDYAPAVAMHEGGAVAVWVRNPQNEMVDSERKDVLMFAQMDENGDWTAPAEIAGITGTISDLSITSRDGVIHLIYALEEDMKYNLEDGTPMTEKGLKKYYAVRFVDGAWTMQKYINPGKAPETFASFVDMDDTLQIILVSATNMYRIDANTRELIEVKELLPEMVAAPDIYAACDGERSAVVWVTGEDDQKIYASVYAKGGWSEAVEVATVSKEYNANNIVATFVGDNLEVVYARHKHSGAGIPTEVCLCKATLLCPADVEESTALEIESFELADSVVMNGSDARFVLEIKNNSVATFDSFDITLKDKTGNVINEKFEVSKPLVGGAKTTVELKTEVEGLTGNIEVEAFIGESLVAAAEYEVVVENMAVSKLSATPTGDGSVIVSAVVRNNGYVDISRDLVLYNTTNGKVVFAEATGNNAAGTNITLSPQEERSVQYTLPATVITGEINICAELVHTGVTELSTEDDSMEITYVPESKFVSGSVEPIFRDDVTIKTRNGSGLKVKMDKITVEVKEDDDVIADANVESAEASADFGVMVPRDENVNVTISAPGFLSRTVSSDAYDNQHQLGLFAGNVVDNHTGAIDAYDLDALIRAYGKNKGDMTEEEWETLKLVEDSIDTVSPNDIALLIKNYGVGYLTYDILDQRAANN